MFNRTRDNLQETCGELYRKTERGIRILRRLYFFEIALLLIIGGVIGVFVSLYAAPNKSFTYSGRITGSDFLPLTDGTYYMRIKLHTHITNDTCAWSTGALATGLNCNDANGIASVPIVLTRSLFSLPIGDTGYTANMPNLASLDFKNNTYFLEVAFAATQNGIYQTLAPRTKLGAAASAVTVLDTLQANTFNQIPGTYTQLDGALTNSATTVTVDSTVGYPSAGTLLVDNEAMTYTATTATIFTGVVRAQLGTAAAAHNDNATVKTYLLSGAASATTRPTFHITSDGNVFINSNAATNDPSINFQVDGTTRYSLGIDRTNNNILRLGTTNPTTSTMLSIDSRSALSGGNNSTYTFSGVNTTLTASNGTDTYSTFTITPGTTTISSNNILALDATRINQPTVAAGAQTVTSASTLAIAGPPLLESGTLTNAYGLKVNTAAVGSVANAYGLAVAAPSGATNNYTAIFTGGNVGIGTTAPITQLHVPGNIPTAQLTSLTTGIGQGTSSVFAQGRYAYITNNLASTNTNRFQVIDLSKLGVSALGASDIIGSIATLSDRPHSVFVQGRYAYVVQWALANSAGTLQVIDISNPKTPASVGSATTTNVPFRLSVQGRYAYIISQPADNNNRFQIFDISNPSSPSLVAQTNTNGVPRDIYVQGRYAYITTDLPALQIFDISNPASPTASGSSATTGTPARGVAVQGRFAYVTSGATNSANIFQIFDIKDPSAPTNTGFGSVSIDNDCRGIALKGRYAYISCLASRTFRVFDISNPTATPTSIVNLGSSVVGDSPYPPFIYGRFALLPLLPGDSAGGLQVFDVGSAYIQQMEVGGLEIADGQVRSNFTIFNNLDVRSGVNIGLGGLYSAGPLSITGLEGASGTQAALDVRNSSGTSVFFVQNSGKIGFMTTTPSYDLSFGAAQRTVGIESQTGSNAGNNLLLQAGNSGSGDNLAGGNLIFRSGNSTGTGISKVQISVPMSNTTPSNNNSANTFFEFANGHLASLATAQTTTLPRVNNNGTCLNGLLGTAATLSGNHTNSEVIITVNSTTDYPATGTLIIDSEIMTYTATSGGNQFTGVTRATNGTTASTHSNTTSVRLYPANTDISGKVIFAGVSTSCTLEFAKAYASAPSCMAVYEDLVNTNPAATLRTTALSTTSVTFSINGTTDIGDKLSYFCIGLGSQ